MSKLFITSYKPLIIGLIDAYPITRSTVVLLNKALRVKYYLTIIIQTVPIYSAGDRLN